MELNFRRSRTLKCVTTLPGCCVTQCLNPLILTFQSSTKKSNTKLLDTPYHAIGIVTQQPEVNMAQLPNSYRATAWFTCLFCCWPLGLMSIKKSNEVETAISLGDIERAQLASKSARNYAIAAVFGGLFVIALLVIYALNL
ncbi:proline-rich transmembrane protein 1-like isoform X1 [Hydra vulgaris]|uniref:Proline-rich transmembrane protein 1-like isoform X1 n=1 Tax=Hydra vulgaris TaxID=6087 RepID=A0ABM4C2V2_HYDVU